MSQYNKPDGTEGKALYRKTKPLFDLLGLRRRRLAKCNRTSELNGINSNRVEYSGRCFDRYTMVVYMSDFIWCHGTCYAIKQWIVCEIAKVLKSCELGK